MAARAKTAQQRQQIIEATDMLMYEKGFNLMSFSDIADASGVPRGNIYYYFKTKDDILAAVIDHRVAGMKHMLAQWDQQIPTPLLRLKRFVQIAHNESPQLIRYGCPMGSLSIELAKAQPAQRRHINAQFDVFRHWLEQQFALLGLQHQAADLAMHLLIHTQGIAVLGQAYADPALVNSEVNKLNQWLDQIAADSTPE